MANRLIGGVLSSKQPQSSGFVSRASTGTHFNQTGTLVTAPINQPRVNYTFSGNPIGTRYSTSFNGSAYLTAPYGSNFNFGTGNFTVEGWIYLNSLASSYYVMAGTWTTGTTDEWLIQIQNNNSIRFLTTTGTTFYSTTISVGQWYHIAGVRNGSTITLYVNGTSVGSYTNANSIGSVSKVTYIGAQQSPIWYVNGFISNFRITNGVAVYTGNFTVPTSPLTSTQSSGTNISAITGTQTALLTCQNNTFIDNSTNAVVLTNSSATVSTFLPPIYPSDFSGTGWSNPTTLIEPASTNIITYSEQIDNAVWSKIALGSRTGITANAATAPDGNTTADLVYVVNGQTSVSGGAYWPYTFTNGVTYTWSCFFKYVGYQYVFMGTDNNNASCVWFDLSAGTVGSTSTGFRGTITNVGNGWYRCATTFTFASASMGNAGPIMGCANVNGSVTLTQAGNGSTGVYMWGAQLEINSLGATSYIPTTGAAVTRAQDTTGVGI